MFILKEWFVYVDGGNIFFCYELFRLEVYRVRNLRLNLVLNVIYLKFCGKIILFIKYK